MKSSSHHKEKRPEPDRPTLRSEMTDRDIDSQIHSKLFEVSAMFILSMIDAGHVPEVATMAAMLGLPVRYVEKGLEHQTVRQFVREHMKMRAKNLASQDDA